jgi:predicted nucleotidyltransferase
MSAIGLARKLASRYEQLRPVQAVALAGSRVSHQEDDASDIDLYVYVTHRLTLEQRVQIAAGAKRVEIGNAFWEPGDEWIDPDSGLGIDVMYRELEWIEEQLNRVIIDHKASIGYTTCFWYNVLHSEMLIDREAWFANLQLRAETPYPTELKQNIVAKNWPILRDNLSSYRHQIDLAIRRGDLVSVNHRVTALLASYFDILFSVNAQLHPGEKRLVTLAEELCTVRPGKMRQHVERLVRNPTLAAVDELVDGLGALLSVQRLLPSTR